MPERESGASGSEGTGGGSRPDRTEAAHRPERLEGERVVLRSFARDDLPHVIRWMDDPELRKEIGAVEPLTEARAEEWFAKVEIDPTRLWYAIVLEGDGRVVGEAGLLRIFEPWRTTDMTVIIGEPDARGRGYGTEAGELLLELAFERLGMHRVAVGVVGFHESAIRFWQKLGFREEGRQRDGYLVDGEFHDFVMMSILENEYRAMRG